MQLNQAHIQAEIHAIDKHINRILWQINRLHNEIAELERSKQRLLALQEDK